MHDLVFSRKKGELMNTYGYIRVSTREQNEDRQRIALRARGIPASRIYTDKQSGGDFDRPRYRALVRRMKKDDLLCVKSIDRLGRNYREILEQWRILTREKGVDIAVLELGTFIADIVLQILSFVAENERDNIRRRQAEGIAAAKARGVIFGRPPRPLPENFPAVYERWKRGELTGAAAARECGMPRTTFRKRAAAYRPEMKE